MSSREGCGQSARGSLGRRVAPPEGDMTCYYDIKYIYISVCLVPASLTIASTSSSAPGGDMVEPMKKQDERERDRIPGITELRA